MHPLIAGNAKSKTSWASVLLLILGALQQSFSESVDLIPDQYEGLAMSLIGALYLILRNLTNQSISEKGARPPLTNTDGYNE